MSCAPLRRMLKACDVLDGRDHQAAAARLFLRRSVDAGHRGPTGDPDVLELDPAVALVEALRGEPRERPDYIEFEGVARLSRVGHRQVNRSRVRGEVFARALWVAGTDPVSDS